MAGGHDYQGGCHCGRVRYEVSVDLASTMTCNCSICQKSGTILSFVPEDRFKLLSGDDALVDYQFNKNVIHHLFCGTCGVRAFGRGTGPDGRRMVAINVRCLDDIDLASLQPVSIDGKSF